MFPECSLNETECSHQVRVQSLPPHVIRLDVSPPLAVSYNIMEWLKEAAPQFTAVHFLAPYMAHYASLARQQVRHSMFIQFSFNVHSILILCSFNAHSINPMFIQ
jgi:hypothetical protein